MKLIDLCTASIIMSYLIQEQRLICYCIMKRFVLATEAQIGQSNNFNFTMFSNRATSLVDKMWFSVSMIVTRWLLQPCASRGISKFVSVSISIIHVQLVQTYNYEILYRQNLPCDDVIAWWCTWRRAVCTHSNSCTSPSIVAQVLQQHHRPNQYQVTIAVELVYPHSELNGEPWRHDVRDHHGHEQTPTLTVNAECFTIPCLPHRCPSPDH